MAVEGGMKCVKFLLYVLLLAFCTCAVGLIAIGVAVQVVLKQAITYETTAGSLLPVVIIAVGAFLFLVAFVGCCGACKENYCLMITVSGVWELLGATGSLFCGEGGWMENTRKVSVIDRVRASPLNPDFKPNSCPPTVCHLPVSYHACGGGCGHCWLCV